MSRLTLSLLVLVLPFALGCREVQAEASDVVNANCPIMGDPVADDGGRTEWNGKKIGFCCSGCIEDWEALDEQGKTKALAKAGKAEHHDGQH